MDCSPPGSSVHGIFQARILEWVAISFSRGSSRPRDGTCVSCIGRWILYLWALYISSNKIFFNRGKKQTNRLGSSRKMEFILLIANLNSSLSLVNLPASTTSSAKELSLSLSILTHTPYWFCFSGEPWLIQMEQPVTSSPPRMAWCTSERCPEVTLLWNDGLRLGSSPFTLHKPLAELAFILSLRPG